MMEAFISAPGDWSVGIAGASARVEFDGGLTSEREWFREELMKLFHEFFDVGKPTVVFSDECDYCRSIMYGGKCHNCVLRDI